jgi:hypothetical protein
VQRKIKPLNHLPVLYYCISAPKIGTLHSQNKTVHAATILFAAAGVAELVELEGVNLLKLYPIAFHLQSILNVLPKMCEFFSMCAEISITKIDTEKPSIREEK